MNLRSTGPERLPAVRRWAAAELSLLAADHLADVVLVMTELVTNAYDHGGGPVCVRLRCSEPPHVVVIEVEDTNTALLTPGRSRFGVDTYRGSGLTLVDRITTDWGVTVHVDDTGKTVWAEVGHTS